MLRLCDEELRKQDKLPEKEKKLPLIYPVVFYTGRNKYTAPRSFYELFEDEKLAKSFFTWRVNTQPISGDDIPRVERPDGWAPNYSPKQIENYKNKYIEMGQLFNSCTNDKHLNAKAVGAQGISG